MLKTSSQRQKQGEATLKDMETLPACDRDGVMKAKSHLEFKLEKDLEHNKFSSIGTLAKKREAKESVGPMFSEIRGPGTKKRGCT